MDFFGLVHTNKMRGAYNMFKTKYSGASEAQKDIHQRLLSYLKGDASDALVLKILDPRIVLEASVTGEMRLSPLSVYFAMFWLYRVGFDLGLAMPRIYSKVVNQYYAEATTSEELACVGHALKETLTQVSLPVQDRYNKTSKRTIRRKNEKEGASQLEKEVKKLTNICFKKLEWFFIWLYPFLLRTFSKFTLSPRTQREWNLNFIVSLCREIQRPAAAETAGLQHGGGHFKTHNEFAADEQLTSKSKKMRAIYEYVYDDPDILVVDGISPHSKKSKSQVDSRRYTHEVVRCRCEGIANPNENFIYINPWESPMIYS